MIHLNCRLTEKHNDKKANQIPLCQSFSSTETHLKTMKLKKHRYGGTKNSQGGWGEFTHRSFWWECADERKPARNSCPKLHFVDSRFGAYHVAVVLSFLRSPISLAVI